MTTKHLAVLLAGGSRLGLPHLWIQDGDWKISVSDGSCDSESCDWRQPNDCLRDLDGQRRVSIVAAPCPICGNLNSIWGEPDSQEESPFRQWQVN